MFRKLLSSTRLDYSRNRCGGCLQKKRTMSPHAQEETAELTGGISHVFTDSGRRQSKECESAN
jgi:hypothetical protein